MKPSFLSPSGESPFLFRVSPTPPLREGRTTAAWVRARAFSHLRHSLSPFGSPYCVGGTNWRHGSPCLQGEPVEKNRFPLFKGEPAGGGSPYNRRIFEQPRVRLTPSFRFPKQTVGTKHASQFPLCSRGNHWKVGSPTFHAGWNRRRQCWKRP